MCTTFACAFRLRPAHTDYRRTSARALKLSMTPLKALSYMSGMPALPPESRLSATHPHPATALCAYDTHRAIAIGYSSMAFAKMHGRAERIPNALVLLAFNPKFRDFLVFASFERISRHQYESGDRVATTTETSRGATTAGKKCLAAPRTPSDDRQHVSRKARLAVVGNSQDRERRQGRPQFGRP